MRYPIRRLHQAAKDVERTAKLYRRHPIHAIKRFAPTWYPVPYARSDVPDAEARRAQRELQASWFSSHGDRLLALVGDVFELMPVATSGCPDAWELRGALARRGCGGCSGGRAKQRGSDIRNSAVAA